MTPQDEALRAGMTHKQIAFLARSVEAMQLVDRKRIDELEAQD